MKKQIILFVALLTIGPLSWAHTGPGAVHHGFWATLVHVLTHADHLFGIVSGSAIILALIAGLRRLKRRLQQTKKVSPSLR